MYAIKNGVSFINLITAEPIRALDWVIQQINILHKEVPQVNISLHRFPHPISTTIYDYTLKSLQNLMQDPNLTIKVWKGSSDKKRSIIYDMNFNFDRENKLALIREHIRKLGDTGISYEKLGIIIIAPTSSPISEEFAYTVRVPLPTHDEILKLLKIIEASFMTSLQIGPIFTDEERSSIVENAKGLQYYAIYNTLRNVVRKKLEKQNWLEELKRLKESELMKANLEPIKPISPGMVGGLENLKEYLTVVSRMFAIKEPPKGFRAIPQLKGILLAGVPGTGKTLSAKMLGNLLGIPVVRLDLGRMMSKWLGESEANFRRALETIEALSPVVVLLDEIEKMFGTAGFQHETTSRIVGDFLYWLQERRAKVYVIATANRIEMLAPEMMRVGRWDKMFYFDLPNFTERKEIFRIHLSRFVETFEGIDIDTIASDSDGFTGAEIEQVVIESVSKAIYSGKPLSTEIIRNTIDATTPLSRTRPDEIERIRSLTSRGFYPASKPEEKNEIDIL